MKYIFVAIFIYLLYIFVEQKKTTLRNLKKFVAVVAVTQSKFTLLPHPSLSDQFSTNLLNAIIWDEKIIIKKKSSSNLKIIAAKVIFFLSF